jgi:hypothetical protein
MGDVDLEQAQKLETYLAKLADNALVLDYATDDELSQKVDTILVSAVSRDQGRANLQLQQTSEPVVRVAEVWPRIDSSETTWGEARITKRDWYLVLSNTGNAPARDVEVSIESPNPDRGLPGIVVDGPDSQPRIDVLAPHGEVRFQLLVAINDAMQINCTVSWIDKRGRQKNTATLLLT